MIKTAGDILAKGLSQGLFVNCVYVYGLAVIDYKGLSGIPMKATVDFEAARTFFMLKTAHAVSVYDGLMWLLKAL